MRSRVRGLWRRGVNEDGKGGRLSYFWLNGLALSFT